MPYNSKVINLHRFQYAKDFKDEYDEFFLGLGRTTAWDDEEDPPEPTGDENDVEEVFGYIASSVPISELSATATIGSGTNGEVNITVNDAGVSGNDYTVEVIDNSGTASVPMDATLLDTTLTVDLGTDGSGNLDPSQNTSSLIADEISLITEFSASASGDGTGVLDTAETVDFSGGAGPTQKCVYLKEVTSEDSYDLIYRDRYFQKIHDVNAQSEGTHHLLFEVIVPLDEFDQVSDYRQIGIYRGLTRVSGDAELLYPDDVSDNGELFSLSNIRPIIRRSDRYEKLSVVLEF